MRRIFGKVRKGKKRGKKLGFPTANIALHDKIPQGIYISTTLIDGKEFESISFVGNATTFGEKEILLETYIFDFDKNIYNKELTVELIKKIRGNKKFESEELLVEEIKKDLEEARKYHMSFPRRRESR